MAKDRRRWTTPEQLDWLQQRHPAYLEAQSQGRYDKFWPKIFQDWFATFPAREPTENDPVDSDLEPESDSEPELQKASTTTSDSTSGSSKRKKKAGADVPNKRKKKRMTAEVPALTQTPTEELTLEQAERRKRLKQGLIIRKTQKSLRSWFRWHVSAPKTARKKRGTTSSGLSIFGEAQVKSHRNYQETELYSKMYYSERILPEVQARVQRDNHRGPQINLIRQVTRELYDKESPETISAVNAALASIKETDLNNVDNADGVARTPEEYQRRAILAINELPEYLDGVTQNIFRLTGHAISFQVGGPLPAANGAISTMSIHIGKNSLGNTFGEAYKEYENSVSRPFQSFLRSVFPAEVRASRSLNSSQESQLVDTEKTIAPELGLPQAAQAPNVLASAETNLSPNAVGSRFEGLHRLDDLPEEDHDRDGISALRTEGDDMFDLIMGTSSDADPESPTITTVNLPTVIPHSTPTAPTEYANSGNITLTTNTSASAAPGSNTQARAAVSEYITPADLPTLIPPLTPIVPTKNANDGNTTPSTSPSTNASESAAPSTNTEACATDTLVPGAPVVTQRPVPRPAYRTALEERAKAEAIATEAKAKAEAIVAEARAKAEAIGVAAAAKNSPPVSPEETADTRPVPSSSARAPVPEAADTSKENEAISGRRKRTQTDFGKRHAQEVAEKLEKAVERKQKAAKNNKAVAKKGPGDKTAHRKKKVKGKK